MSRLFKREISTFNRDPGGGYYDIDGKWKELPTTTITANGNRQPIDSQHVVRVLEEKGISSEDSFVFFSDTYLKTASEFGKTKADTTIINGLTYRVFAVKDWTTSGDRLGHWECILVRDNQ